jgi:hypothetical protein
MAFAKARFLAVAVLLLGWLGYLAYQALAFGRFPVVSHSQLLVSTLDVIADVRVDNDGRPVPRVLVHEVHWPADQQKLSGQEIEVVNLSDPSLKGFAGAGRYILPLEKADGSAYRVAHLPRSPGFNGERSCFIYPDTPITRGQLDEVRKPGANASLAPGIQ